MSFAHQNPARGPSSPPLEPPQAPSSILPPLSLPYRDRERPQEHRHHIPHPQQHQHQHQHHQHLHHYHHFDPRQRQEQSRHQDRPQLPTAHRDLNPLSLPALPPAYSPKTSLPSMNFSAPPQSDPLPSILPPLSPPSHYDSKDQMLPSLSSITGEHALRGGAHLEQSFPSPPPPPSSSQWPPMDTSMAYRQPPVQQADSPAPNMDFDGSSVASAPSPDHTPDTNANGVTIDDPDVRLAAEALGDLRADFVSSPPDTNGGTMSPPPNFTPLAPSKPASPQSEPLLSLLTTSHPFLASTIGNASSAYGGAKNFSPRFKSGAEYVEGYLTPIANTVNSVGRVTGFEGGVRWFLGGRRRQGGPSDPETVGNSKKRRKVGTGLDIKASGAGEGDNVNQSSPDDSSPSTPKSSRRLSTTSTVDTLPAYDDLRSPAYSEVGPTQQPPSSAPTSNQPWQSRLIMSTSGLSVAMSAESLRSLKYCLRWLRWSNGHMGRAIGNLKVALEEYDKAAREEKALSEGVVESEGEGEGADGQTREKKLQQSRTEIAAKINSIKGDILKSLQDVVNNVSKYAGGALPENARVLVRRHLTSLPQRFRVATMSDNTAEGADRDADSAIVAGAQKVLVLAKEGLDMVTQVSGVLDGTIVSAEQWCERMGKRRRREKDEDEMMQSPSEPHAETQPQFASDVKMAESN